MTNLTKTSLLISLILIGIGCSKDDDKPSSLKVKDIDGNVYNVVQIGTQTWMAENLKTTKLNDGTEIPLITDNTEWIGLTTKGYCWYNNEITNKNEYGALYNWYTVNTNKLCPQGWHVPTEAEWITLEAYLIANGYNYDGTNIGDKIAKSLASKTNWAASANEGAVGNTDYSTFRNKSGFSAVPAGTRADDGNFYSKGSFVCWWSSTEKTGTEALRRSLSVDNVDFEYSQRKKIIGYSVRCVKD